MLAVITHRLTRSLALLGLASTSLASAAEPTPTEVAAAVERKAAVATLGDVDLQAALEEALPASTTGEGPFDLESRAVSLELDAFGSFGSSTVGGDAVFDDGSLRAGTVFESMAHVGGVGYLDGETLLLPQSAAGARRDGTGVVASYALGSFRIELRSELLDCEAVDCAVLRQSWRLTNVSAADSPLVFSHYIDGDLFFSGHYGNDHGAVSGDTVYQFDEGSDPTAPSTFLGLRSEAPAALRSAREVGEYSEQRRRVRSGGPVLDRLVRADGTDADADGDGVTDTGFDVSLAVSHDFGLLAPGEAVDVTVEIQWGIGTVAELGELSPDAGPDRVVECEGADGTVVVVDGSASEPAGDIVAWRWLLDGEPVAEGPVAELLLLPGEHVVSLEVEDSIGRVASDEASLRVVDTIGPDLRVLETPVLWPPNHRLVEVDVPIAVSDACSDTHETRLLGVFSDEPNEVRAGGDGNAAPDAVLTADGRLLLRAERQGGGDGRVYLVFGKVSDEAGNSEPFLFEVHVPHSPPEPAQRSGVAEVTRF